ncbi:hypothetical protein QTP88_005873 [Uroleucon formosanum]
MNKVVNEVTDRTMTYREAQDGFEVPWSTLLRMIKKEKENTEVLKVKIGPIRTVFSANKEKEILKRHSDLSLQVPEKTLAARAKGFNKPVEKCWINISFNQIKFSIVMKLELVMCQNANPKSWPQKVVNKLDL